MTLREKLTIELEGWERICDTLSKKYIELLDQEEVTPLTEYEQEHKQWLASRVNNAAENFVKAHSALAALPAVTHDLTWKPGQS